MRDCKGRGGVTRIIGVLLREGSSGSGSVVANSAKVTERRYHVNNNISQLFLSFLASLCSASLYVLRLIKTTHP